MSAERADAEAEVIDLTAYLLAGIAEREPDLLAELLPTALPWARFLPAADVTTFIEEFISTVRAAASLGNLAAVSQLLTEWRHTAEVHADPELHRALTQPLGDFGPVLRP
jgi:hypothetical protein